MKLLSLLLLYKMSIPYDPPHFNANFIFNEFDYNTDIITSNNETVDVSKLVQKSGDIMTGVLSIPSLNIYDTNGSLEFSDATEQTTAFSQTYIDRINAVSNSNTDNLNVVDITFADSSIQNTAFTTALKNTINDNNIDLTNISYTDSNTTTSISNNVYCQNLTCGNINTSYLSTLNSNVQTQIDNISLTNYVTTNTTQDISGAKTFSANINTTGDYLKNGYSLLPIGSIIMYAGRIAPTLFVSCNGQSLSRTLFPELFAVCDITYGSESSTTFNIPDLRGMFVRCVGTNTITGITSVLGQVQPSSIESHSHGFSSISDTGLSDSNALTGVELLNVVGGVLDKVFKKFTNPITNFINKTTSSMLNSAGASVGVSAETRPVCIVLTYMIKIR